jgi:hypothetical protein
VNNVEVFGLATNQFEWVTTSIRALADQVWSPAKDGHELTDHLEETIPPTY